MKKAGKIIWLVYGLVGSLLFLWDGSARGEHIAGSLIVAAYSLPSSLILIPLASVLPAYDQSPWLMWFLMVTLNGWLLYRFCCLLSRRKKEPNQSLEPTAPSGRGSS
jgi:hypothetical protein